jgi:hypothetical protein
MKTQTMKTQSTIKDTSRYIGCDYYGSNIDHLVISTALGVTSDPYNNEYIDGNRVIILAREGERIFGYLAVADGTTCGTAGQYWPKYHHPENITNRVRPVTHIHEIPADMVGRLGLRGIQQQYRDDVANYLKIQG